MTDTHQETVDRPGPDRAPILQAVSIGKTFPIRTGMVGKSATVHAAEAISLDLLPGTVTAIVGESGSGKSTISRVLAAVTEPTSGKLLFDGRELRRSRRAVRRYRSDVQLVLQDPFASLNPVHKVRYILSRPLRLHGVGRGQVESRIRELLETVALEPVDQFIDKYPHELSGGQRQRVAIARALAVRPKVLLADEPVSMLDVSIRLGLLNLLADLRDNDDLAIVYVTHDIASARYLADTIAVMYAGRIVEHGPATEVTENPRHPYTRLLVDSAPDPDRDGAMRSSARGAPPSLVDPPTGCRFHPRCPFAMPVCSTSAPALTPIEPAHLSACWLHDGAVPLAVTTAE